MHTPLNLLPGVYTPELCLSSGGVPAVCPTHDGPQMPLRAFTAPLVIHLCQDVSIYIYIYMHVCVCLSVCPYLHTYLCMHA